MFCVLIDEDHVSTYRTSRDQAPDFIWLPAGDRFQAQFSEDTLGRIEEPTARKYRYLRTTVTPTGHQVPVYVRHN